MKATKFLKLLESKGFDFFTGVPCSYFTALCDRLAQREDSFHVAAVREDLAVGLASGAYLGGKQPVVYMQNSGLGYSLEAFASLPLIYHIPMLVLISNRGPQDRGMEEHMIMGKHTESILKDFEIPYTIFQDELTPEDIDNIKEHLATNKKPYVLLTQKGALT